MNESDKALIRRFLASDVGQRWLEEGRNSYVYPDLGKVPMDAYTAAQIEGAGWRKAFHWMQHSGIEVTTPEFGVQPIDTSVD